MSCDTAAKTIVKVTTNTYFPYYPHNSKFLVCNEEASFTSDIFSQDSSRAEEAGDSSPVPGKVRETYLRIGTDHNPKDQGLGFVFGRDRDNADILLDVREHSPISKKLFTIKIVWDTGVILIKNLSSHGINIHSIYYGSIKMKSQRVLKHGDILTVRLAEFDLTIQLPDHTQHAEQAEKYWAEYLARFASGIPSLRDLDLRSLRSSTGASRMIYSLESEIGRGKHGLVYRAIHQRTGQVFAAKKYYEMQASALREGAIMQHISHRNIVKFHDYISTGQASPLLIMEFIPGKMSLASEHQSSPFSILELRAIDSQLLCALSYLHQKQIIHGNLKLTKVLLVYRNPIYIKVTDFREASISDHQRIPYLRDIYRAPEIVDGRYSNKVDIWSVGIMTLELSDLALPQCPETPDELLCVIENHLRITPSPLTNFISRLVQHNPDRRPSADESVCDDFFNIDLDFTEIASADLIPTSQPTQRKRQISTSLLSDYQELTWNGRAVNWVPSKGIINLTQLLAASGMVKKERDRVLKKYVDKCREQSAAGNNATKGSYFLLHDAFDICKALGFGYETIEKLMYGYTDLERCHPVQNHSQVHAKDAIICGSIQANPKNSGVGKGGLGGNTHHKAKRKRTKKNDEAILEDAYVSCSKPDTEMYARLEDQVALSKQEIRKWFQNRRQKDRVSRHGGKLRSTYQSW